MSRLREVAIHSREYDAWQSVRLVSMLPQRNRDYLVEPMSHSFRMARFFMQSKEYVQEPLSRYVFSGSYFLHKKKIPAVIRQVPKWILRPVIEPLISTEIVTQIATKVKI